jgi:glycosyltransferase involved in cell wall biosynthesis
MTRLLHILPHPGGGGERIVEMLAAMAQDFEHRTAYLTRSRNPVRAAATIAAGRPRLAREVAEADLVNVIGDTSACLTARLLGRRPAVIETQGLHLLRRSEGPVRALVTRALRAAVARSAVTVCSSAPELSELRAICAPGDAARLRLVENGIPLPDAVDAAERAAARAELGLDESTFVVLYAGQLEPRKQPLVAAESVSALSRDAVLLVAGDGPVRERLERFPRESVRVLGFRPDVSRLLGASDAFVMPSEREGLSLAVLEAMGRGIPVLASDGAGNPEAVGDAGIVFPLGDPPALTRALEELASAPDRRRRLGEAARERVRDRYTIERWVDDMRQAFADALAGAPRQGA